MSSKIEGDTPDHSSSEDSQRSEPQKFLEVLKKKYLELYMDSRMDWMKRQANSLEFFAWVKQNAPFSNEEKKILFPSKVEKDSLLTREEKKQKMRWWKWKRNRQ